MPVRAILKRIALSLGTVVTVASAEAAAMQPPASPPAAEQPSGPAKEIEYFTVRDGYQVTAAVANLPGARFLEIDDKGVLYVSRPNSGDIIAFRDADGDGVFETRADFITGKPFAHAMCFAGEGGWLWFATSGSIHKARDVDGDGGADEVVDILPRADQPLPAGSAHWWRSLLVTADSIYTSIGDAGNISDQSDTDRQKVWRFDLDGSNKRLFISGVRNTEKLLLRPGTQEIWGCDHGSDWFGASAGDIDGDQPITDLNPPDELNHYTEGGFYGHPFIVGSRLPRYEYREKQDIHDLAARTIPPEWPIPAHWASNGFCFLQSKGEGKPGAMPADHAGDILVACHGSWNSTQPVGYCIARILFDDGHPYGLLKIVSTLETQTGVVRARPVDCVQAPDGSVLFSSDQPGRVYHIRYVGKK